ncbi:MAK10-like protein [Tanacetum coccineum]
MAPLRSDTIRLVHNGCLFHGLRSEDLNQHLKDFLKLVDSLDLDGENRERTRLRLFQFPFHNQASNWLERLPAGSITTWDDLTTRFLTQFFPPGRTTKLCNDILMFQQHHGESLSKAWTRFKDLLQKVPHHDIDLWLQVQIFYDHINPVTRRTIDQSAGGKLRDRNAKESRALLEDLTLYDNESWNDPRDFAKPVMAIALPQDVPSTSDCHLIELKKQVQCLMEAHLALKQPTQVNKITTSCEIYSAPHDTQHCMEDPKQAFVEYASSRTDEAGGKWYTFKPEQNNLGDTYNPSWRIHPNHRRIGIHFMGSQDARLSKFKDDFKQQQSEMTIKINTVLKAITDQIEGALPSDTVKNPKPSTTLVLSAHSYAKIDPQCSSHPSNLINAIKAYHAPIYNAILDKYVESLELGKNGSAFVQGEIPTKIKDPRLFTLPCRLGDLKPFDTLADLGSCVNIIPLYLFRKINIRLLEETGHIFGLADRTKSYLVGIVKDVEVHIGKLKLLNDFYVIDMKKDHETPLLVGRGFLATANVVIDYRMDKIAIREGITRKDFLDCHLPGEWEIARDVELNPFKDTLVFRRMVEFLRAIPINLKSNMWGSEDLIKKPINWDKSPKNRDGAWHAKIRLINPDGEEFTKTNSQSPPLGSSPKEKFQGKSST